MDTKSIIDYCLRAVGEQDPAAPITLTRPEALELINIAYQGPIADRLKLMKIYSYDGSDADHTIVAGVGSLPADFKKMSRVYDGDAPVNTPLRLIRDINKRVSDSAAPTQYFLPGTGEIWIFGLTPTDEIKLYYYYEPDALADDESSSPLYLPKQFHLKPFVKVVQGWYSTKDFAFFDEQELEIFLQDILDEIEEVRGSMGRDEAPPVDVVREEY